MDNVNHPAHYETGFATRSVECIDVTRHLPFSLGNAVKYLWRAGKKGDKAKAFEDLDKAEWYIDDFVSSDTPDSYPTACAVFKQCTCPGRGNVPLEAARYDAIYYLIRKQMWEVREAIIRMRKLL